MNDTNLHRLREEARLAGDDVLVVLVDVALGECDYDLEEWQRAAIVRRGVDPGREDARERARALCLRAFYIRPPNTR